MSGRPYGAPSGAKVSDTISLFVENKKSMEMNEKKGNVEDGKGGVRGTSWKVSMR